MNNTGIIRKIDDLGRIVLPKELRKYLNINTGEDFQITVSDEKIILEKYSRLSNFEDEIMKIINCFSTITNNSIYLIINSKIINYDEIITSDINQLIQERKIYIKDTVQINQISNNIKKEGRLILYPIVLNSDLLGSLIIIGNDSIDKLMIYTKIIDRLIKEKFNCN